MGGPDGPARVSRSAFRPGPGGVRWRVRGWSVDDDRDQYREHGPVRPAADRASGDDDGQEVFRAEDGCFVAVWHQEDLPGMLAQLGLQPPPVLMRLAARQSAWRYRRGRPR